MRNAFAKEITLLAGEDERIVLLSADIGNRLFDDFKADYPNRFYNCGVAEANMIGVAAGLAMCGLRPVCYTITPFVTYRCMEQIRVDLCYHRQPVVIVGTGSGLSYASLGPTHHSCEEMGMLRLLPEMQVFAPGDSVELRAILRSALHQDSPCYLRIGKKGEPTIHEHEIESWQPGTSIRLVKGEGICFLACGTIATAALDAARKLTERGMYPEVWSCPSVKPLDVGLLKHVFTQHQMVITVEEHVRNGGFGSAVAEWLADQPTIANQSIPRAKLLRLGTEDAFYHEIGSQSDAREFYGLSSEKLAEHVFHSFQLL